jgi:hypothetical protein
MLCALEALLLICSLVLLPAHIGTAAMSLCLEGDMKKSRKWLEIARIGRDSSAVVLRDKASG